MCRECTSKYAEITSFVSGGLVYKECGCKPEMFLGEDTGCCDRSAGQIPVAGTSECRVCDKNCKSCIQQGESQDCLDNIIKLVLGSKALKDECFTNFVQNKGYCEKEGVGLLLVDYEIDARREIVISIKFSIENNLSDHIFKMIADQSS